MQQPADPGDELLIQRLVEAERGADALELLGGCGIARQDRGGIARRQPQQQEHDQRDHPHHGNGGQYAAKQISEHPCPNIRREPVDRSGAISFPAGSVSGQQFLCHCTSF